MLAMKRDSFFFLYINYAKKITKGYNSTHINAILYILQPQLCKIQMVIYACLPFLNT